MGNDHKMIRDLLQDISQHPEKVGKLEARVARLAAQAIKQLVEERDALADEVDAWKQLAGQINTDWIPANRALAADLAECRISLGAIHALVGRVSHDIIRGECERQIPELRGIGGA